MIIYSGIGVGERGHCHEQEVVINSDRLPKHDDESKVNKLSRKLALGSGSQIVVTRKALV